MTTPAASRRAEGVGAIGLATFAFGSGPVVATVTPTPTATVVILRFVLAVPLLLALLALTHRRLTLSAFVRSLPGGLLLPLQVWLFFGAARLTSVADATFIMSLQPIVVFVVAPRLFGERLTLGTTAWGVVGVVGVGLVVFGSSGAGTAHLSGELVAVLNLFVWAAYLLASKWARSGPDPVGAFEFQTAVNVTGAVVMVGAAAIVRPELGAIPASGWLGIAYLTATTGVVGHVLNTWAQRFVDQTLGSIILLGQTAVAAVGAAIFLDQPLAPPSVVGGVLVLVAAAVVIRGASATPPVRVSPGPVHREESLHEVRAS